MRTFFTFLLLAFFYCAPSLLNAQNTEAFGFELWNGPLVTTNEGTLSNAWAGGLNNVQFGAIDFNADGFDDLVVFDRHGDRLLPFIFVPGSQSVPYRYAPEFRKYFPILKHWFQLLDYDNDGRQDLFTYTPGGIMVYRNVGEDMPKFIEVVDPYILSFQGTIFTNLLVTYVDYPVIQDLDGDGDMDILTFWGLGSYVDLHQNMSMELYGNADSLIFHKVEGCWGRFAENPESNIIYLDTCYQKSSGNDFPKHTGSTFCLLDMNGDRVKDLILGDVDYSEPAFLINGGDDFNALMTGQLEAYPDSAGIDLWSFPLVQHLQIGNYTQKSLLISSFDPSLVKSRGDKSVWLYENVSKDEVPDFKLRTRSFLQNTMIDAGNGAYPVFVDVNQDGLLDIVLGNYGNIDTCLYNTNGQLKCFYNGRLKLFVNSGDALNPAFTLVDDDFADISQYNLRSVFPSFSDLDGDGKTDMVLGNEEGNLWFFRNISSISGLPEYDPPIENYQSIDVGANSTPVFVSFTDDGMASLVIGNSDGKLYLYQNSGTHENPVFEMVSDFFGGVEVTDPFVSYTGFSVPCFFKDAEGQFNLLVGSESGYLHHYTQISIDPGAVFKLESRNFLYISEGIRTAPALADINADGFIDLAIGNYAGGMTLFKGRTPGPFGIDEHTNSVPQMNIFPNPTKGKFHIRLNMPGEWSVRIVDTQGRIVKQKQINKATEVVFNAEIFVSGLYYILAIDQKQPGVLVNGRILITQ